MKNFSKIYLICDGYHRIILHDYAKFQSLTNQNDLTNSEPMRAYNVSTNFEFKFTSKFERQVI